ncbi:MAG: AraC family transcriptional regulator [Cyanobacteriota bacterium]|nr:AraC family transcriptional regulator [Cyanobacteriota bacterium]
MKSHPPAPSQLPLAFGNARAHHDHDPDQLAHSVSRAVPLRDLTPGKSASPFLHRSAHVQVGSLGITAAAHSPLHGSNHAHSKAVFSLPTLGEKRFRISGHTHLARAGHSALFLPGEAYSLQTTLCSGVMFSLCPRELAALAASMAGEASGARFKPIERPLPILESHPRQGKLLALLRRSLNLIDVAMRNGSCVPKSLGLDDKIQRLIAMMVYPELIGTADLEVQRPSRIKQGLFAELLAAIQLNPLDDWNLTRMERWLSCSQHDLLWHFQGTFGCGPLEWLRHQRLSWARRRLDDCEPVCHQQLALQCGYLDLASFRHDFEAHFLLPPEAIQPGLAF